MPPTARSHLTVTQCNRRWDPGNPWCAITRNNSDALSGPLRTPLAGSTCLQELNGQELVSLVRQALQETGGRQPRRTPPPESTTAR
jgi:hypothetical protein